MKLALVSDAWRPQVNGVARTLAALHDGLKAAGHDVFPLTPELFRTVPCPTDREVRLAIAARPRLTRLLDVLAPDAIHIATEGPLGTAARKYCLKRNLHFTTAYHTKYPEYLEARFGVPKAWTYAILRRFHCRSSAIMVATETVRRQLAQNGFEQLALWTRGVDIGLFRPGCTPPPSICLHQYFYAFRALRQRKICRSSSTSICPARSWLWATATYCRK